MLMIFVLVIIVLLFFLIRLLRITPHYYFFLNDCFPYDSGGDEDKTLDVGGGGDDDGAEELLDGSALPLEIVYRILDSIAVPYELNGYAKYMSLRAIQYNNMCAYQLRVFAKTPLGQAHMAKIYRMIGLFHSMSDHYIHHTREFLRTRRRVNGEYRVSYDDLQDYLRMRPNMLDLGAGRVPVTFLGVPYFRRGLSLSAVALGDCFPLLLKNAKRNCDTHHYKNECMFLAFLVQYKRTFSRFGFEKEYQEFYIKMGELPISYGDMFFRFRRFRFSELDTEICIFGNIFTNAPVELLDDSDRGPSFGLTKVSGLFFSFRCPHLILKKVTGVSCKYTQPDCSDHVDKIMGNVKMLKILEIRGYQPDLETLLGTLIRHRRYCRVEIHVCKFNYLDTYYYCLDKYMRKQIGFLYSGCGGGGGARVVNASVAIDRYPGDMVLKDASFPWVKRCVPSCRNMVIKIEKFGFIADGIDSFDFIVKL